MDISTVQKMIKINNDFVINKTKAKTYYQANKEKMQKRSRDYNGNLPENEKVKKAIILTIKIKICHMFIEKKEKNI